MRTKIYLISIIFLLGFFILMAARQFMAEFTWRMANQDGKEPNKIIGYLEKCIAIDNENALFHFSLGRIFLQKGLAETTRLRERNNWIRKSIDEFHRAIELEPSNSDYHFHLGLSYGCLAYPPPFYWEIIQNSFKRATILNPTDERHLYSIGIYYVNEYDRIKTIGSNIEKIGFDNYNKNLAMSKGSYQFYFKKLLDVNEEYLGKILNKCFAINPQYDDLKEVIRDTPNSHAILARFLNKKGMWNEAKKEYRMAINKDPSNPRYYSDFAYALFRRGDVEHAIHWWQKQKSLNPRDEKPYLCSVKGFVKLKRFDGALRELRDLLTLYPENISYQIKFIRILIAAGRVDEAIDEYYNMMEKDPHFSREMYDSIVYFQKKGNYKKATKILNKALISTINR